MSARGEPRFARASNRLTRGLTRRGGPAVRRRPRRESPPLSMKSLLVLLCALVASPQPAPRAKIVAAPAHVDGCDPPSHDYARAACAAERVNARRGHPALRALDEAEARRGVLDAAAPRTAAPRAPCDACLETIDAMLIGRRSRGAAASRLVRAGQRTLAKASRRRRGPRPRGHVDISQRRGSSAGRWSLETGPRRRRGQMSSAGAGARGPKESPEPIAPPPRTVADHGQDARIVRGPIESGDGAASTSSAGQGTLAKGPLRSREQREGQSEISDANEPAAHKKQRRRGQARGARRGAPRSGRKRNDAARSRRAVLDGAAAPRPRRRRSEAHGAGRDFAEGHRRARRRAGARRRRAGRRNR